MARLKVSYEWVTEEIDQHGDIEDVNGWDTLADALAMVKRSEQRVDVGLAVSWGNDEEGMVDREYVYLEDGKLPTEFKSGHKVPKRFHNEVSSAA